MEWLAFGVVRHADALAILLGEPYGTIILTLSVVGIEVVMISAVMVTGGDNPALARDTLFSVLMIVLNGMLGVTLLVGGLRHREQSYNLQGATSYLGVLIPLAGLGLILPRYMTGAPGGEVTPLFALWLVVVSGGLYGAFLWIQALRHSAFFRQPNPRDGAEEVCTDQHQRPDGPRSPGPLLHLCDADLRLSGQRGRVAHHRLLSVRPSPLCGRGSARRCGQLPLLDVPQGARCGVCELRDSRSREIRLDLG